MASLNSAGPQYRNVLSGKEIGGLVERGTKAIVKGATVARKVQGDYKTGKYRELRKNAEGLRDARDKQAQSLMARERVRRQGVADAEMETFQAAKVDRQKQARIKKITKNLESNYGQPKAGASVSSAQMRGPAAPTSSTGGV